MTGYYVDPADYPPLDEPEPASPPPERVSPRMRVWRTGVQALLAFLASLPAAVALLPTGQISETTLAWILAVPPALTVIISGVWNTIDARNA